MEEFWHSSVGQISGNAEDAFAKEFSLVPDGEMARATIKSFTIDDMYEKMFVIKWGLAEGDFKGQEVTQKIRCFDKDANKRHRALNMLKLVYQTFNIKPSSAGEPDAGELSRFGGKVAGIKVRQWGMEMKETGEYKEGNFVSEVHLERGFVAVAGKLKDLKTKSSTPPSFMPPTPMSENPAPVGFEEDTLPF